MTRSFACGILVCVLVLCGTSAADEWQTVPVANAGFEKGELGGVPDDWDHLVFGHIRGKVALTHERPHTGKRSVRLEAGKGEGCVLYSAPVPCKEGDRFRASCWIFNEESHASFYIKFLSHGAEMRSDGDYAYRVDQTAGKWSQVVVSKEAPSLADHAFVQLYVPLGAYGRHYFDDVSMAMIPGPPLAAEKGPFKIGTRKELFTDEALIEEKNNVELVLHPGKKHPANPVFRCEKPWEGWRCYLYGSVMYDEDESIFKMWYIVGSPYFTCYATSKDGIHWERPALDLPEFKEYGKGNNIVGRFYLCSVFKDKKDPDPQRRWKMVCWYGLPLPGSKPNPDGKRPRYGYTAMISPDGIHWKLHQYQICPGGDVITAVYDEANNRHIACPKMGARIGKFWRRSFGIMTSRDFDHWTKPKLCICADLEDDKTIARRIEASRPIIQAPDDPALMRTEFYGVGLMPYESVCLGFIWVFSVNNNSLWAGNQEGPIELQLAGSRDLYHWNRCGGRRQIIEQGKARTATDKDWDCGVITTPNCPIVVGDEIWLYYGGHNITHGDSALYKNDPRRGTQATAAIGLATWRLDGFMSAKAGGEPGTLTTKPVILEGNRLVINADAKAGRVEVELLDENGRPIPGLDGNSCDAFTGDSVRHTVTWKGKSDLSAFAGRPVRVRFHLRNADLYSYAFRRN